jgi:hypothetical protein
MQVRVLRSTKQALRTLPAHGAGHAQATAYMETACHNVRIFAYPNDRALAGRVRGRVIDRADECVTVHPPVDRIDQRSRAMLEALVIKDNDVTRI